jgi:hypothetical protein
LKSLFTVLVLGTSLISIELAAQSSGASRRRVEERLVARRGAAIEMPTVGGTINVIRELNLKPTDEVVSLFIIAQSTSRSFARIEVRDEGYVLARDQLSRGLESLQIRVDRRVRDLGSLEIIVDGAASIDYLAASVYSSGGSGSGQELTFEETIRGLYNSGTFDSDRAEALADYNARCDAWKKERELESRGRIVMLTCGTLKSIGGSYGYQFESQARVVISADVTTKEISQSILGIYEGGTFDSDRSVAMADYEKRCEEFKAGVSKTVGAVVFSSCGTLETVGGSYGFQYRSQGRIVIDADEATRQLNEKISGLYEAGTFDSDRSIALNDYEARCAEWKSEISRYNPGRVLFLSCGPMAATGGSYGFRYESEAVALLLAR